MRIVFIGAGNLATHLSVALAKAGHDIVQVYSRTEASATALAARVGAVPTNNVDDVRHDADIYIMAVKDDVVAGLAERLCPQCRDALFVHTAGSVPMEVFRGKARRYGVLYPMQSFSKNRPLDLTCVPVYIEADSADTLTALKLLAEDVSTKVRVMDSDARRHLHLAAVFACNFVNCCYDLASGIMGDIDVPFSDFLPLIDETAAKVHDLTPHEAQTGPAVRYDASVIERQRHLLASRPDVQRVYEVMSGIIHRLHQAEG